MCVLLVKCFFRCTSCMNRLPHGVHLCGLRVHTNLPCVSRLCRFLLEAVWNCFPQWSQGNRAVRNKIWVQSDCVRKRMLLSPFRCAAHCASRVHRQIGRGGGSGCMTVDVHVAVPPTPRRTCFDKHRMCACTSILHLVFAFTSTLLSVALAMLRLHYTGAPRCALVPPSGGGLPPRRTYKMQAAIAASVFQRTRQLRQWGAPAEAAINTCILTVRCNGQSTFF